MQHTIQTEAIEPSLNAVDKVANLLEKLLKAIDRSKAATSEVENVVVEISIELKNVGDESVKLQQLKALLKSLG